MNLKTFIIINFSLFVFGCTEEKKEFKNQNKRVETNHHGLDSLMNKNDFPFYHGVASGDPTTNAVIIWTRYTLKYHQNYSIDWEVSLQKDFTTVIQQGKFETNEERDYTVKVDVQNLDPGTTYYFRFKNGKDISPIGRTKTIPANPDKIKLAFASCSNYAWGYFNAYRMMGDDSLDVVIHLGDYIYEHEPEVYNAHMKGRTHIPAKELLSLSDYRTRYAQYRLDEDLKYVHAMHPFITIWDDHELANNAYDDGAGNHQENEGDWKERLAAAKKAYYEWMPIRENNGHHYRSFQFGDLANLIMLDTRTEGRDKQPSSVNVNDFDSTKHLLNDEHFAWLENEFKKKVSWQILGNQILFYDLNIFFSKTAQLYNDGWSAYRFDQKRMKNLLESVKGAIIVSGDFHSSFAIHEQKIDNNQNLQFIEYIVPSISSANYDEDYGLDSANIYKEWYQKANPNLVYHNLINHGYFTLEITHENSIGEFKFVDNILQKDFKKLSGKKLTFSYN